MPVVKHFKRRSINLDDGNFHRAELLAEQMGTSVSGTVRPVDLSGVQRMAKQADRSEGGGRTLRTNLVKFRGSCLISNLHCSLRFSTFRQVTHHRKEFYTERNYLCAYL